MRGTTCRDFSAIHRRENARQIILLRINRDKYQNQFLEEIDRYRFFSLRSFVRSLACSSLNHLASCYVEQLCILTD